MLERDWVGNGFYTPPSWPVKPDECPGRLIQLPQVIEAARASWATDKGVFLSRYGDDVTELLIDAIEIYQTECSATEQQMLEDAQ
jgi:hypothetical protein